MKMKLKKPRKIFRINNFFVFSLIFFISISLLNYYEFWLFFKDKESWYTNFARKSYYAGMYEKSLENVNKALISNPENQEAHLLKSILLKKKGDYDDAILELYLFNKGDSNDTKAEYYFQLGDINLKKGLLNRSIDSFKRSIYYNPKYIGSHIHLGICQILSGSHEEGLSHLSFAQDMFEEVPPINRKPFQARIHLGKSIAYKHKGEKILSEKEYDSFINLTPDGNYEIFLLYLSEKPKI